MTIREARQFCQSQLISVTDPSEREEIFWRLAEHLTDLGRLRLKTDPEITLSETDLVPLCAALKTGRPVQYVLGFEWWGEMKLKVNENVLIPRPETEELARLVIRHIRMYHDDSCSVIDLGTGSGCIPILIKREYPKARVSGIDISMQALEIARENATLQQVEIDLYQANILDLPILWKGDAWDFIISNPPYIHPDEAAQMDERVKNFEPQSALFVSDGDPLQFYKPIAHFAKQNLKPDGMLFLETGKDHAEAVYFFMEGIGFHTSLLPDFLGIDRFVLAKRKKPVR